jgi:RNA polymerase sigma-70 factor (ECF subfamily)
MQIPGEAELRSIQEKIATGDQNAFRQLFGIYSKKLISFSASIVRSKEAAREIVDEVFIRVWKNRTEITSIGNLRVYLYTAAKNTSLNYLSAKARENIAEPFDYFAVQLSDESESPEKKLMTAELLKKIHNAIDSLPPRCKMVFKLVREDGLSYREVAHILNISPKTVDAQMVIAVKQVSEKVQADFDCFPRRQARKK